MKLLILAAWTLIIGFFYVGIPLAVIFVAWHFIHKLW